DSLGSLASRTLSETPRLTSLSLNTSRTALARSSLLARISTPCSPDQAIDAPTLRKSNRWLTSLPAWFSALSTSCRSSLDTMSNEASAGISLLPGGHGGRKPGPRLDAAASRVTSGHARTLCGALSSGLRHPSSRQRQRPLSSSVPLDIRRSLAGCPSGQRERSVKPSA